MEQISFDRLTLLMWLLPLMVVTALLLDIILIAGIINIGIPDHLLLVFIIHLINLNQLQFPDPHPSVSLACPPLVGPGHRGQGGGEQEG